MFRAIVLAAALVAAGCTQAVHLRNAQTGQLASCGPYANGFWLGGADSDAEREARCLDDYQRIGFERVP